MSDWQPSASAHPLTAGHAHVWRVGLALPEAHWHALLPLLADDEVAKVERFHFAKHRRRHAVSRAALRILLGRYLARPPRSIAFSYNAHGKPQLTGAEQRIRFNISHTEDIMLAAFVLDREVGIDIESMSRDVDCLALGRRWFSALESRALQSLPEEQRIDAFFRAWCRKEAYIKARGEGMSHPLQRFSVSLDKDRPRLIEHLDDHRETTRWTFLDLDVADDCRAALVIEGTPWRIDRFHMDIPPLNP